MKIPGHEDHLVLPAALGAAGAVLYCHTCRCEIRTSDPAAMDVELLLREERNPKPPTPRFDEPGG